MNGLDHLTKEKVENVCDEMWKLCGALRGIGTVLQQQVHDPCYEGDDLFGLGQLFESMSEQIARLEDILRSGYDSMAVPKGGNADGRNESDQSTDEKDKKARRKAKRKKR